MSSKQPNGRVESPKYITDFSKALAGEMRILLDEVGKLRDERRQLQYEIAELMAMKAKHSAGGEFYSGWGPSPMEIAPPPPESPPEPPAAIAPAPPAWRTVHKRPERKPKQGKIAAPPAQQSPPPPPAPDSGPSWAQWRPNPLLAPEPRPGMPVPSTPHARSGLFGPPTPPPK